FLRIFFFGNRFPGIFCGALLGKSLFRGTLFSGTLFSGTPGKKKWLRDGVGHGGWNERWRGSALERLTQTLGTHKFPRLRHTGDTITHLEDPPLNPAMGMVEREESYGKLLG
ncbi:MAG: hypothetical protein WA881_17245, partial [Candidatus Sulfotelmatobacter sp.]